MTTKQTASASADAKPKHGEVLIYIDFEGRKIFGKDEASTAQKDKETDK
jgi:hypothetical protein